ncbi:mRNA polyadenylation protein [Malassezia pachydermatis]
MCTCQDRSPMGHHLWQIVGAIKERIHTTLDHGSLGARIGAVKAAQRLIQVQTQPDGDPRLQNRAEINVNAVPSDHPFLQATALESEADQVFTKLVTLFFTCSAPSLVMATTHVLTRLARLRTKLHKVVIEAFISWTPTALASLAPVHIRSAENTVRLAMVHFLQHGSVEPQTTQLTQALERQKERMDLAMREAQAAQREGLARKRESQKEAEPSTSKRARGLTPTDPRRPTGLTAEQVAQLPLDHVVDAIIAGLQSVPEDRLKTAIETFVRASAPTASSEPVDPLKMDVGDDDVPTVALTTRPATAADDVVPLASLEHFEMPAPTPLDDKEVQALIVDSVSRICENGSQLVPAQALERVSEGHAALWIKLVVRLATRGFATSMPSMETPAVLTTQADRVRTMLVEFVSQDFAERRGIAQQWLTEEWACDRWRQANQADATSMYDVWLDKVLDTQLSSPLIDDVALANFLRDLPQVPLAVLDRLYELCLDRSTIGEGFSLLRDVSAARPPLRVPVCHKVLQLTRHSERLVRGKAIVTARTWVLQKGPLAEVVLAFARESLQLLVEEAQAHAKDEDAVPATVEAEEAEETAADPLGLNEQDVLRLIELALVLSVKQPGFFAEVVRIYPLVPAPVQAAMQKHVTPVARSVGPNSTALLDVLRHYPEGADSLVVALLRILIDKGHTRALAELVRDLCATRNLSVEFLLPLVPQLDREAMLEALPRVVSVLADGSEEHKVEVHRLFQTLIAPALQAAGAEAAGEQPTTTASVTPVELLVLLHVHEKDIGLKAALQAVQICFSMSEIFRSDVLTAVLNRLVEEEPVPVLFMRTAIMATKAFRTLGSYVSTSLLSRLVQKEIWREPRLWDGFALCANLTAPTSFGALLQLPMPQLQELVQKQPGLREPLRDYLVYKAGGPSRHGALLAMLDQVAK